MIAVRLSLLLVSAVAARAQVDMVPLPDRDAPQAEALFARAPTATPMKCALKPSAPLLNFSLQYDGGFRLTFPVDPRRGPSQKLNILLRLRSAHPGQKPLYMAARIDLSSAPREKEAVLTGRFGVASGTWQADALAIDSKGRECRTGWRAEIKAGPEPGPANSSRILRGIVVMLDAAPIHQAFGSFPQSDLETFIGSLSAVLRFFPAQSTRLVVFNLEQRKELFRSDEFQPAALKDVALTIHRIPAGTVDYGDLQRIPSASEFLAGLIDREIRDPKAADLVVFIGPVVQDSVPPAHSMFPSQRLHPVFAYLQLKPARYIGQGPPCVKTRMTGGMTGDAACPPDMHAGIRLPALPVPDAISKLTTAFGGETAGVNDPTDLAKALKDLAGRTQTVREKQ